MQGPQGMQENRMQGPQNRMQGPQEGVFPRMCRLSGPEQGLMPGQQPQGMHPNRMPRPQQPGMIQRPQGPLFRQQGPPQQEGMTPRMQRSPQEGGIRPGMNRLPGEGMNPRMQRPPDGMMHGAQQPMFSGRMVAPLQEQGTPPDEEGMFVDEDAAYVGHGGGEALLPTPPAQHPPSLLSVPARPTKEGSKWCDLCLI
jgi:hypothetical protein